MLSFNDQSRIVLFNKPINFHKGIDALYQIIQMELGFSLVPNLYVIFSNRRKNRVKMLYHNGKYLILLSTRLENSLKFTYPESPTYFDSNSFHAFINNVSRRRGKQF